MIHEPSSVSFQRQVVPLFDPIRKANREGTNPWTFPPKTLMDDKGRPYAKLKDTLNLLPKRTD